MKYVVIGGGGFIGGHFARQKKMEGHEVVVVDLKEHKFWDKEDIADEYYLRDMRYLENMQELIDDEVDFVAQFAADFGGAGYCFVGENDASIMHNSSTINLHLCHILAKMEQPPEILYTSSACMYPEEKQMDTETPFALKESDAYPANPDSEYGWEKLFSERVYQSFERNYGLNVNIARLHNIFGSHGAWRGGREKAPAAICRKVAEAGDGGDIEVWGSGEQVRTFLHVDQCLEGFEKLIESDFSGPVNIGSDETITIDGLVDMVTDIADKDIGKNHIPGPTGVKARSSNNELIEEKLGWSPDNRLKEDMSRLYSWIEKQVEKYGNKSYNDKISEELEI